MNCEEFRAAALAGEETVESLAHMAGCPACRSRYADIVEMRDALAEETLWEEPSPELGASIESLIGSAARGDHGAARFGTAGRRWMAIAAAVAAVVLIVGSFVVNRGQPPDWEVALPATSEAPGAIASVKGWNVDSGTRMVLEVAGLAPAPDGFMYEFWLSDGPLHISAGTFRSDGAIELWSGVTRANFPRLWVTLEPIDEDESPSSVTVLDTGVDAA